LSVSEAAHVTSIKLAIIPRVVRLPFGMQRQGRVINNNLGDYLIATNADIPMSR